MTDQLDLFAQGSCRLLAFPPSRWHAHVAAVARALLAREGGSRDRLRRQECNQVRIELYGLGLPMAVVEPAVIEFDQAVENAMRRQVVLDALAERDG